MTWKFGSMWSYRVYLIRVMSIAFINKLAKLTIYLPFYGHVDVNYHHTRPRTTNFWNNSYLHHEIKQISYQSAHIFEAVPLHN